MARAYIKGDLEIEGVHPGDPYEMLKAIDDDLQRQPAADGRRPLRWAAALGVRAPSCRRRCREQEVVPPAPPRPAALAASATRSAISYHYDVSNTFYEHGARPVDDLHLRLLPDRGRDAGAGPGSTSTTWSPASSACSPGCGCSTSAAAGAAWCGTRPSTTACSALGVTLSREQATWAPGADQGRGPRPTWPRCGTSTTATCAERDFDAVSSIGLIEHIGVKNYPAYFRFLRGPAAPGRPAAQPRHHPAGQQAPRAAAARLHRPLRVPRRRAHRLGRHRARDGGRRPRGAAPGEPAGALRQHAARVVRRTSSSTGTSASPRPACRSPRCGASTWPAPGWRSSATASSCTRCSPPAPRQTATSGYPLRHDFGV